MSAVECRLNHVCLTVTDLELASRFYERALGAKRLKDVTNAHGQAFVRFLRLGEGVVELFQRGDAPAGRTGHLAVHVDDAAAACDAIRAAGYEVGQPFAGSQLQVCWANEGIHGDATG